MKTLQVTDLGNLQYRVSLHLSPSSAAADAPLEDLHTEVEIGVVTAGRGVFRFLNQSVECRSGDVFILNRGVPHGYFATDGGECPTVVSLRFSPTDWLEGEPADEKNDRYCFGLFWDSIPVSYALLHAGMLEQTGSLLSSIGEEMQEERAEWRERVRAYLTLLLTSLMRYVNLADVERPLRPKGWATVSAALRYLLEHYADSSLTLETVSAFCYISQAQLSRLFRNVTGEGFSDYLRRLRIVEACRLLRRTSLTVEEVAEGCGLKDLPSFYRHFKEQTGLTPSAYRSSAKPGESTLQDQSGSLLSDIAEQLSLGRAKQVEELVQKALESGLSAAEILENGLLKGLGVIGEKFKAGAAYVPEVLVAARAMNMGAQLLKPHLAEADVQAKGKVCIGTVQGDLHDIGKNLVRMMMEGRGLEVIDLGTDVPAETFVQTAVEQGCRVICCSALLSTTMNIMADVVKAAEAAGIRNKVKIMIGGAPITQEFCDLIGADCYTVDAASAAEAALRFCRE